jgi:hypothetical protein
MMASVKTYQDFAWLLISKIRFVLRGSFSTHPPLIGGPNDEHLIVTTHNAVLLFPTILC